METEQSSVRNKPLTIYRWQAPSLIGRLQVEGIAAGRVRCRLWPASDADAGQLKELTNQLIKHGFRDVYADVTDGENVLVVDRLRSPKSLLQFLVESHSVTGEATVEQPSNVAQSSPLQGALSSIKGDTIKWSGRVGLIGHALFFGVGLIKHDRKTMLGATGAINPIILAVYGNGKSEINFNQMMDKMMAYFRAEGMEYAENIRYQPPPQTLVGGVNELLSAYPLQIGHGLGCVGAYNNVLSGVQQYRSGNSASLGLAAAGTTSLLGNLMIMFIPETKKDRDDETTTLDSISYGLRHIPQGVQFAATKPHRVPGHLWGFIQDSPLRANGIMNASDNVSLFVHALGQFRKQRIDPAAYGGLLKQLGVSKQMYRRIDNATPYMWMTTAFSWGMATFLSAISSKNRSSDYLQDDMFEPMYAAAAKFLVQVPEADRTDVLKRMATFLADQEEVKDGKISVEKIVEEVQKRIDTLAKSPWLQATETEEKKAMAR